MKRNRRPPRAILAGIASILLATGVWGGSARGEISTKHYLEMASERSNQKNYLGAAFLYERVLARDTTQVDVLYKLGDAYRAMGALYPSYFAKAETVYRRVEALVGKHDFEMRKTWAAFYASKWEFDPAISILEGLLGDRPDDCDLWIKLGDYERLKGMKVRRSEGIPAEEEQMTKAEEVYQRTLELCPDRLEPYRGLGIIYNQRKDYGKTAEMYAALMEKHPDNLDLVRGWTVAEYSGRNWAEAAKGLKRLLAEDPQPEERLQYMYVLGKIGREDEAAEQKKIYMETAPKRYGPDPLLRTDVLKERFSVDEKAKEYESLLEAKKFDEAADLLRKLKSEIEPLLQSEDEKDRDAAQYLLDWLDRRIAYADTLKARASG